MEEVTLVAESRRGLGKGPARRARRDGRVPGIVYGLGADPTPVAVPERDLAHILSGPGGVNTLINLELDGDRQLVLARQVQRHPVRHELLHVDLVRVSRDVAITAEVPLRMVGDEIPGVKDGGILEQVVFTLTVEAKPADLPAGIDVDVSSLDIGDHILVSEISLPRGVATTQDPEDLVVHVVQPRGMVLPEEIAAAEEAEAAAEAEAEAAEAAEAEGEGAPPVTAIPPGAPVPEPSEES
jgi:large subunit ribosomal protein L25